MQRRVMEKALATLGVRPRSIGLVHAHATSTPWGTGWRRRPSSRIWRHVPVTSTRKPHTGHLLGGAGALAAIVVVQALKTGHLPGTVNIEALDPEVNLNVVTENAHTLAHGSAPAGPEENAFGFGGHSVALVITGS